MAALLSDYAPSPPDNVKAQSMCQISIPIANGLLVSNVHEEAKPCWNNWRRSACFLLTATLNL
jgi:hypothetical protein